MSWKTVRRALKRLGASYRRARRVPARARAEKKEARFAKALEKARILAEQGAIDILHGDESGFCLLPPVPYLWQLKGLTVGLPAQSHNQRLNVLGFWREAGVEAARLFHCLVLGRLKSTHVNVRRGRATAAVSGAPHGFAAGQRRPASLQAHQAKTQRLENRRSACLVFAALLPASQFDGGRLEASQASSPATG